MNNAETTLQDLGELRLIDEIIAPMARRCDEQTETGNDCAYIPVSECLLAVTADVGPRPLLHRLKGYENDWEAAGWLAVVATASDVATAGARPLFLTNCIDAPPELPVEDLKRLLSGYFAACSALGFRNGGGDIRQGTHLAIRVFAAGTCQKSYKIGRDKASSGDLLYAIGPTGQFMAHYLIAESILETETKIPEPVENVLRFPQPQLEAMEILAGRDLIIAASDTSDGLMGALDNIARKSCRSFHLTLSEKMLTPVLRQAAQLRSIDPWNIFFAWGDWSVVVVVRSENQDEFERICRENGILHERLGVMTEHEKTATIDDGPTRDVTVLRNENFTKRGFNAKLGDHLAHLLKTPLFR